MKLSVLFISFILLLTILPVAHAGAAEYGDNAQKEWKVSTGAGLFVAPAFTGARSYSLLAVPDLRIVYKDIFFTNIKDGIGYALVHQDGWHAGPVVSYTFRRSEKAGGSIFQIAGSENNALQGMGDVPGTVSLGGFAEYSLKRYKLRLHVQKGVTGHEGLVAELKASYGGALKFYGPPIIYSFGPHIKFGDSKYTNAYWGVTSEQSVRSGLDQYHADGGITAFGIGGFAMIPLTDAISISLITGFDRLGPPVAHSPLVRFRGSENQAMGGVFISYGF